MRNSMRWIIVFSTLVLSCKDTNKKVITDFEIKSNSETKSFQKFVENNKIFSIVQQDFIFKEITGIDSSNSVILFFTFTNGYNSSINIDLDSISNIRFSMGKDTSSLDIKDLQLSGDLLQNYQAEISKLNATDLFYQTTPEMDTNYATNHWCLYALFIRGKPKHYFYFNALAIRDEGSNFIKFSNYSTWDLTQSLGQVPD